MSITSSEFPPRILDLLREVARRTETETHGLWEDGEPLQDDADVAIAWISARAFAPSAAPAPVQGVGATDEDRRNALVAIGKAAVAAGWRDGELADFVRDRLDRARVTPACQDVANLLTDSAVEFEGHDPEAGIHRNQGAADLCRQLAACLSAPAADAATPRYAEWKHLQEHGQWSDGVPAWARDHRGQMNEGIAARAVIDELAAAANRVLTTEI